MNPHVAQYWLVFLKGAGITLWISWLALILGGLIGAVIGLARTSRWRVLEAAALVYTEVFRSIPPLILFFGCFYGVSYAINLDLSPFGAATIALTAVASAFMSEVVRAGIESVGRGQWEAAQSSGMRYWQIQRYVVWPQAIRVMLPPSVGVYISTLKDSSLASVIGYLELTKSGMLIRETTGVSFDVFLIVATLYFVINYSISLGGAALERRFWFVH
ncbi:MAG: amino acid ABC transporter permease [Proteobacteria bacterium]|nr:amino acid ABC transporter permease [Pseudomonadota bacterium]MBI3499866.1 amino acid ABC transporter permease [Pseudomonadota bacterium]